MDNNRNIQQYTMVIITINVLSLVLSLTDIAIPVRNSAMNQSNVMKKSIGVIITDF